MEPNVKIQRGGGCQEITHELAERGSHHALNVDKAKWITQVSKEELGGSV